MSRPLFWCFGVWHLHSHKIRTQNSNQNERALGPMMSLERPMCLSINTMSSDISCLFMMSFPIQWYAHSVGLNHHVFIHRGDPNLDRRIQIDRLLLAILDTFDVILWKCRISLGWGASERDQRCYGAKGPRRGICPRWYNRSRSHGGPGSVPGGLPLMESSSACVLETRRMASSEPGGLHPIEHPGLSNIIIILTYVLSCLLTLFWDRKQALAGCTPALCCNIFLSSRAAVRPITRRYNSTDVMLGTTTSYYYSHR